jgi:hypothetical protein
MNFASPHNLFFAIDLTFREIGAVLKNQNHPPASLNYLADIIFLKNTEK